MTAEYIVTEAQRLDIVAAIREACTASREAGYAASTFVHDRHTHLSILDRRRERARTVEADKHAEMWISVYSAFGQ